MRPAGDAPRNSRGVRLPGRRSTLAANSRVAISGRSCTSAVFPQIVTYDVNVTSYTGRQHDWHRDSLFARPCRAHLDSRLLQAHRRFDPIRAWHSVRDDFAAAFNCAVPLTVCAQPARPSQDVHGDPPYCGAAQSRRSCRPCRRKHELHAVSYYCFSFRCRHDANRSCASRRTGMVTRGSS